MEQPIYNHALHMIEIRYRMRPDKKGVFDGREIASLLLRDAYMLLATYAGDSFKNARKLFGITAHDIRSYVRKSYGDEDILDKTVFTVRGASDPEMVHHSYDQEKGMLELRYGARYEENGIIDGIALAWNLMFDAYKLLSVHAACSISACDKLFAEAAGEAMAAVDKENEPRDRPKTWFLSADKDEAKVRKALGRHLKSRQQRVQELLNRAEKIDD